MKPRYATLSEHIYSKIKQWIFKWVVETILFNYSMILMGTPQRKDQLEKNMH